MNPPPEWIGFIGLGNQGGAIALRMLRSGLAMTVCDLRTEVTDGFAERGAAVAATPSAVGAACDFVGICVVDDDSVRQVASGPAGLIAAMAPGGVIAIHSTVLPNTCRTLAAEAATRGITVIDAPVSGGAKRAETGELVVMVGGDVATVARCTPIFASFATKIVHMGPVGAGQLAKAVNNGLAAAHYALGHEALAAGLALGLDRAALVEVLTSGSAASAALAGVVQFPAITDFRHGARLLHKDVDIMRACANSPEALTLVATADRLQAHVFGDVPLVKVPAAL